MPPPGPPTWDPRRTPPCPIDTRGTHIAPTRNPNMGPYGTHGGPPPHKHAWHPQIPPIPHYGTLWDPRRTPPPHRHAWEPQDPQYGTPWEQRGGSRHPQNSRGTPNPEYGTLWDPRRTPPPHRHAWDPHRPPPRNPNMGLYGNHGGPPPHKHAWDPKLPPDPPTWDPMGPTDDPPRPIDTRGTHIASPRNPNMGPYGTHG